MQIEVYAQAVGEITRKIISEFLRNI